MLAIWGRETDYGRYALPYNAMRVLATQAYVGRRKEQYRGEFIAGAEDDRRTATVTRKDLRSSWAGATGLTQFLPSEFYKHGVDFDGDGRIDIWTFGAGCAGLRRAAACRTRAGSRACAGPMRCARRATPIARRACRK